MTLQEVIRAIEGVAAQQPNVRTIVRQDVFRLNDRPDVNYSAFAWLQRDHSGAVGDNLLRFGFTFFYVDRLEADKGNEVEVQSEGMNVLMNVVVELAELGIMGDEWTARTFTQRFADLCAGAYLNVTLEVPADWTCPVDYDVEDEVDIVKDENTNEKTIWQK